MSALTHLLHGAIDLHVHSSPSPMPRRLTHVEAARQAETAGFRAIVVKCHFHNTVMDLIAAAPLLEGLARQLPKERVVVEILESVRPTPEVVSACRRLKEEGYVIALDDFVFDEALVELIRLADIVKVDFLDGRSDPRGLAERLRHRGLLLLAEKLETAESFQQALDWGYDLFQGNFFAPPELLVLGSGRVREAR